jgi:pre-mRNA-splicing factor SYF1
MVEIFFGEIYSTNRYFHHRGYLYPVLVLMCDVWPLSTLVGPECLDYETKLAKTPHDDAVWLQYAASVQSTTRKVFIMERSVQLNPLSVELWHSYIDMVLELAEPLQFYHHRTQLVNVNRLFERAVLCLNKEDGESDNMWTKYLVFLTEKQTANVTFVRNAFNRCLASLPVLLHGTVWPLYLKFADSVGGATGSTIYAKYLVYNPPELDVEMVLSKFIEYNDETAAISLFESILATPEKFTLSKSLLETWWDYIEYLVQTALDSQTSSGGEISRWDVQVEAKILFAVAKFPDQMAKLYTTLTTYYINRDNGAKVRYFFDLALSTCVTVPDFVMIYNDYLDYEEQVVDSLSRNLPHDLTAFDFRMNSYEYLLQNRSLLLNDVLLRKDRNNLDTWYGRLGLFKDDLDTILRVYAEALTQINPLKAHSGNKEHSLPQLWIDYANVYACKQDYKTTNLIFSKAVTSQFASLDQLSDLYIKWSEMLLESSLDDAENKAISVIETVLFKAPSNKTEENKSIHDEIPTSKTLWGFYIDLLESFVDSAEQQENIERVCKAYDRLIDTKLATAQNVLDYAAFLQSWTFWERSYAVYERGLKLFPDSRIKFELWNCYLEKVLARKLSIDRTRDLFDQCLSGNTGTRIGGYLCAPIVKMYSKFEQDNNSVMKSIKCIELGIKLIRKSILVDKLLKPESEKALDDKFELYGILIDKWTSIKASDELRAIFEDAVKDDQLRFAELIALVQRFVDFETMEKQYTRARALFKFVCRLTHPESLTIKPTWSKWEEFELKFGNEPSFKEMLRFKRLVGEELKQEELIKDSLNPMGFIKSETIQKGKQPTILENPDQIDIDMDM